MLRPLQVRQQISFGEIFENFAIELRNGSAEPASKI